MAKGHRLDLTPIQKHRGEWFRRIHVPWYLHGTPRHFQEYHDCTFEKPLFAKSFTMFVDMYYGRTKI